jgi:hypothetical protein
MDLDFPKIAPLLNRIKTPLTLGGLVVVVLYGLYSQILKLPGFAAALPSGAAAQLLQDIIKYLFWLAILAVALGVGSYLAVHFFPKGWLPDPDESVALKVNRRTRKPKSNPPTDGQET